MALSSEGIALQRQLKTELLANCRTAALEQLAAELIGTLLDLRIATAKAGFQHGADAGPAGRSGRRFRVECKHYGESSHLSDRELLGEIDQALDRDPALEAWILVATRSVPEQTLQSLSQKGARIGVPVSVIDWPDDRGAALAALCTADPETVTQCSTVAAGEAARKLGAELGPLLNQIRRELAPWHLGFESLRKHSHLSVEHVWTSAEASLAQLAQDVAGGTRAARVRRHKVHAQLQNWWTATPVGAAAAVIGTEGVGKTWAVMDWLVDTLESHPIIALLPATAVPASRDISVASMSRFLGAHLHALTQTQDSEHWTRRVEFLLRRPQDEGTVFTLLVDGLNQHSAVPWIPFFRMLQSDPFVGRVRVIATTRPHHFLDKLSELRSLQVPPVRIPVEPYDLTPGGELDQMLAFEGLQHASLHPDLLALARIPRLFRLVMRFRDRLVEAGQVTVHRLLWEYGRDTFGDQDGTSFSEQQWRAWLTDIAGRFRKGKNTFSTQEIATMVGRADFNPSEIYSRLSSVVDGRFTELTASGELRMSPTIVSHALGAALLSHLDAVASRPAQSVSETLAKWLDPIAGLDQRAEVLRAAVSIFVERGDSFSHAAGGTLLCAWLHSQNLPDTHGAEITALAPLLPGALIDAIEDSSEHSYSAARDCAVRALRSISPDHSKALGIIHSRALAVFSIVPRHLDRIGDDEDRRRSQREYWRKRVGADAEGTFRILGLDITLVENRASSVELAIVRVLEAFPLAPAASVMKAAAIARSLGGALRSWDALKWICLLNEKDPEQTMVAFRRLADDLCNRAPEPGIHPELGAQAASLLLGLCGNEDDEATAARVSPPLGRAWNYDRDYLADPGSSSFSLERRHAASVLSDSKLSVGRRLQRSSTLLLDPTFALPDDFIPSLVAAATSLDLNQVHRSRQRAAEDHWHDDLMPALARCEPRVLADMGRRALGLIGTCADEEVYWRAIHVPDYLLVAGPQEKLAAKVGRSRGITAHPGERAFAITNLLFVEIHDLHAFEQFSTLIMSDLTPIYTTVGDVIRPPSSNDVDRLIEAASGHTSKQQQDLLYLLSTQSLTLSDKGWEWLVRMMRSAESKLAEIALKTLAHSDARRLGHTLQRDGWRTGSPHSHVANHYGSLSLIQATASLPFEDIATRIVPSLTARAARIRGEEPAEVTLAANILSGALEVSRVPDADLGGHISACTDGGWPVKLRISPRRTSSDDGDPTKALRQAFDAEAQQAALDEASSAAIKQIADVRDAGGSLFLSTFEVEDVSCLVRRAWPIVETWLEGMAARTADFRRRVSMARYLYVALCESLLHIRPELGEALWRALREVTETRYLGTAGVDILIHAAFRAKDSAPVNQLRHALLAPPLSISDSDLFDVALAALAANRLDVIHTFVQLDRDSSLSWRRRRAEVLEGFVGNKDLPVTEAWPEGPLATSHAESRRTAARLAWRDACARHWWSQYLDASSSEDAYAAWVLFLQTADRRAWVWMHNDEYVKPNGRAPFHLDDRLRYASLQHSELEQAMKRRSDRLDRQFLFRDICEHVSPWASE